MKQKFKRRFTGDSGYPLEPWIITPYRSATERSAEARFNTKHSKTRNCIERCIGVLKARFRCLLSSRELHYTPEKACQIMNVCCMLHNICIHFNVDFEEDTVILENDDDLINVSEIDTPDNMRLTAIANTLRDNIKNSII